MSGINSKICENSNYSATLIISQNVEPWEAEKSEEDMEYYDWEKNKSKKTYITLKYWPQKIDPSEMDKISLDDDDKAKEYKEAVTSLFNDGEYSFSGQDEASNYTHA